MAQQKGVTPYSTAKRLVESGLMDAEALRVGVANGKIAKPPKTRDYGVDQELYEAAQQYLDQLNERTQDYVLCVMCRSKNPDGKDK